ncbi:hypothetical protein PRV_00175 [Mycoplasma parvum str. Indiana]|uniref:DNA gyrase subunit A n=2 Tax=Mycoplasma parvum TaxID=984991 RepID=U5NBX2_9MOLU|nr:hypothetical protein PRV_00175 [Mycoplasma parvum str. Indiana]
MLVIFTKLEKIFSIPEEKFNIGERKGEGINLKKYLSQGDIVKDIIRTSEESDLLIFTAFGRVYRINSNKVQVLRKASKKVELQDVRELLDLKEPEFPSIDKVVRIISADQKDYQNNPFAFLGTKEGMVKKMFLGEFQSVRRSGAKIISLRGDDDLLDVKIIGKDDEIFLTSTSGHLVRFKSSEVREMGREAIGVEGINLSNKKDLPNFQVISISCRTEGEEIFTLTRKGKSKYTKLDEYKLTGRGRKGMYAYKFKEKNGELLTCFAISVFNTSEFLFLITSSGKVVRLRADAISSRKNRASAGVGIIRLDKKKQEEVVHCFKYMEFKK